MVEFDVHNLQKIKLAVHILQALLVVVSWILDIIVFRSDAEIDGRLGWHFGVCFLTIIPLVYLTMVNRFPRTRKFANPYALMVVDLLFAIIWLSAFATVANYNATGKCKKGCNVSKAVVGLGVVLWIFWALTTAMSAYGLIYYRREGHLPGVSRAPHNASMIDPDKEAFSTAPHDDEYAPVHNTDDHELESAPGRYDGPSTSLGSRYDGSYAGDNPGYGEAAPSYSTNSPSYGAAGAYQAPHMNEDTSYSGYSGAAASTSDIGGRAQFPTGRYDNV